MEAAAPAPAPTEATELVPKDEESEEDKMTMMEWVKGPGKWVIWMLWICVLQFFATVANILIAVSAVDVIKDLKLTDSQFGSAIGLCYDLPFGLGSLVYALGVIGGIPLRPHYFISISAVVNTLGATLCGSAETFGELAVFRVVAGLGMVPMLPGMSSLIEEICPPGYLGKAWGVFTGFTVLAISVGNFVAGGLNPTIGWRNSIRIFGLCGMGLGGLLVFFPPPPPLKRVHTGWGNFRPFRMPAGDTLELKTCVPRAVTIAPALPILCLGALFINVQSGAQSFVQEWLTEERDFDQSQGNFLVGICMIIGCILGVIMAVSFADRLVDKYGFNRPQVLAVFLALLLPFDLMMTESASRSGWFYIGMIGSLTQGVSVGLLYASMQELSPPRIASATSGIVQAFTEFGNSGGSTFGGMIADSLIESGNPEPYTWVLRIGFWSVSVTIVSALWAARTFTADRAAFFELVGDPPEESEEGASAPSASEAAADDNVVQGVEDGKKEPLNYGSLS